MATLLPGLPHYEGPYHLPSLYPGMTKFCCSLLLRHTAVSFPPTESSPKRTTAIIRQSFYSPYTMPECAENVCDCCKNDGMKIGALAKKEGRNLFKQTQMVQTLLRLLNWSLRGSLPHRLPQGGEVPDKTLPGWGSPQGWPPEAWGMALAVGLSWHPHEFWALMKGSSLGLLL